MILNLGRDFYGKIVDPETYKWVKLRDLVNEDMELNVINDPFS
jgi:hypothetical protein